LLEQLLIFHLSNEAFQWCMVYSIEWLDGKEKGKFYPIICQEGTEGARGIALLFL